MTDPAATTAAVGPAVEEPKSTTRPYRIYNVELDLDPNQTTYVSFAELETEADREHATTTAAIVAEQPKMDEAMADSGDVASGAQTHFGDDSFYAQLLKNAQNYELSDEDEGDEEEESSRQRRKDDDNYDFNDPFIDDADAINMGVRRPRPKGVDGFFVWRGPLPTTQGSDGEDTVDKDALDTKRASGKAKAAQRSSSTATMLMEIDSVTTTTATTTNSNSNSNNNSNNNTSSSNNASKPKGGPRKPRAKSNNTEDKERKPARKKEKEVIVIPDEATSEKARSTSAETDDNQAITRESTVGMEVEMESDIAKAKRKNSKVNVEEANMDTNGAAEPDKKRRKQVLPPLADELVMLMNELKEAATHVVFEKKGKFPVELKTPLLNLAMAAQYLSPTKDFDDTFIGHLATVLPFRKNDIRKLVHRIVFPAQLRMLQLELEQTMQSFRDQIEATMRVQLALYDGLINAKTRDDISPAPANTNTNNNSNNNNASMSDSQMEEGDGAGGNGELARKFRWTRDLRSQFWQIIDLREQIALKESQIQGLHTKAPDVKLQSIRKQVYADLIGLWPDGWMTTNLLSREYSAYKRLLAERAKNAASSPTVSFVPVIPNHLSSMDNRRGTSTNSPEPIELDRTELATSTNQQQQQQHRHHQQHQFSTPPPPPLSSTDNMQMDARTSPHMYYSSTAAATAADYTAFSANSEEYDQSASPSLIPQSVSHYGHEPSSLSSNNTHRDRHYYDTQHATHTHSSMTLPPPQASSTASPHSYSPHSAHYHHTHRHAHHHQQQQQQQQQHRHPMTSSYITSNGGDAIREESSIDYRHQSPVTGSPHVHSHSNTPRSHHSVNYDTHSPHLHRHHHHHSHNRSTASPHHQHHSPHHRHQHQHHSQQEQQQQQQQSPYRTTISSYDRNTASSHYYEDGRTSPTPLGRRDRRSTILSVDSLLAPVPDHQK